jgi:hypothetical protein
VFSSGHRVTRHCPQRLYGNFYSRTLCIAVCRRAAATQGHSSMKRALLTTALFLGLFSFRPANHINALAYVSGLH